MKLQVPTVGRRSLIERFLWDPLGSKSAFLLHFLALSFIPGRGVLPEKLGRGLRPASQNLYPINDQNLRFSLPYLFNLIPYL